MFLNDSVLQEMGIFELLALGDRERIHTEMLHWIVGYSNIPIKDKLNFVSRLCGLNADQYVAIENCKTEDDHMDLTFDLISQDRDSPTHVVIENKFKSLDGRDQLKTYDDKLSKKYEYHKPIKIYLTPLGKSPVSGTGWKIVSYSDLIGALSSISYNKDPFVSEYKKNLDRLVYVINKVRSSPDVYVKDIFESNETPSLFAKYVREAKLTKLLELTWMEELASLLFKDEETSTINQHYNIEMGASMAGKSLLDIIVCYIKNVNSGEVYRIGIQLQNRSFKVFCAPFKYDSERLESKKKDVKILLEKVFFYLNGVNLKSIKPTASKGKGFSSYVYRPNDAEFSYEYDKVLDIYKILIPKISNIIKDCPSGFLPVESSQLSESQGSLRIIKECGLL